MNLCLQSHVFSFKKTKTPNVGYVSLMEQCKNPLKPKCPNDDIVAYIQIGQERLPLCHQCWIDMAESSVEWGEDGLKTEEDMQFRLL